MNQVFDATATDVSFTSLPADKCPDGPVSTGVARLSPFGLQGQVGVWEHPVGTSTDVEADEVFVVLSGRGRVITADGEILPLQPGTVGILVAGTHTTWVIEETLRKVWVTPVDQVIRVRTGERGVDAL